LIVMMAAAFCWPPSVLGELTKDQLIFWGDAAERFLKARGEIGK